MASKDVVDLTQTDDENEHSDSTQSDSENLESPARPVARELNVLIKRQTIAMSRKNRIMYSREGDTNIVERAKKAVNDVYKAIPEEDTISTFVTSAGCGNFSISLTASAIPVMYDRMRLHDGDRILWIGYGTGKEPIALVLWAAIHGVSVSVIGYEISDGAVTVARRRLARAIKQNPSYPDLKASLLLQNSQDILNVEPRDVPLPYTHVYTTAPEPTLRFKWAELALNGVATRMIVGFRTPHFDNTNTNSSLIGRPNPNLGGKYKNTSIMPFLPSDAITTVYLAGHGREQRQLVFAPLNYQTRVRIIDELNLALTDEDPLLPEAYFKRIFKKIRFNDTNNTYWTLSHFLRKHYVSFSFVIKHRDLWMRIAYAKMAKEMR